MNRIDSFMKPLAWFMAILLAAFVAGCGGGDGTATSTDTSAPTVNSTTPANMATGVVLSTNITATFSEAMDPATITTSTFTLTQVSPILAAALPLNVPGTVSYAGTTATFNPTNNLDANFNYTATITTGVKDLTGNPLAVTKTWSFSTGTVILSANPTAPTLGEAGRFVILASQTITRAGVTDIRDGDMGIMDQARSYMTNGGFTPGVGPGEFTELTNGLSYAPDDSNTIAAAPYATPFPYPLHTSTPNIGDQWTTTGAMLTQAKTDLGIAFTYLTSTNLTAPTNTLVSTELGGTVITPGVYYTAVDATISTPLQLDAQGDANAVWIFWIDGGLTTGATGNITFVGGTGSAKNVYWATGGDTTIASGTAFLGNVLAWTQVIVNDGATITGSLYAVTAQVTLSANTVTKAP